MMKPQDIDQQLAEMRDNLPRMWWALYEGCKQTGFTDEQSLRLVIAFIHSMSTTS